MGTVRVAVDGVSLDALEAYLSSDRSPPDSMLLSDLDGFLTGIAIGPETVMPSEWLPVVWDGAETVFADDAEMQAVFGGMMSRFNEIVRQVADGTYRPILWEAADGTVVAADWAEGFSLAMALRADAWLPLLDSDRYAPLLVPILGLCGDESGDSALGLAAGIEDTLHDHAPEALPACVTGIAAFWRKRRTGRRGVVRVDRRQAAAWRKPGRNEPCPCGSGRKFKKCCGAGA